MLHLRALKTRENASRVPSNQPSTLPTHIRTPALGGRALQGSVPSFPIELIDDVFAHLHDDKTALTACALTCKAWTMFAFEHLYNAIEISPDRPLCFPILPTTGTLDEARSHHASLDTRFLQFQNWLSTEKPIDVRPFIRVLRLRGKGSMARSDSVDITKHLSYSGLTQIMPSLRRLELHSLIINDVSPLHLSTSLARFCGVSDLRMEQCSLLLVQDLHDLHSTNQLHQWALEPPLRSAKPCPVLMFQSLQLTNCTANFHPRLEPMTTISIEPLINVRFCASLRRLQVSVRTNRDIGHLTTLFAGAVKSTLEHLSIFVHSNEISHGESTFYNTDLTDYVAPLVSATASLEVLKSVEFRFDVCKSYYSTNPWLFARAFVSDVAQPTRQLILALRNGTKFTDVSNYIEDSIPELGLLQDAICGSQVKFGSVEFRIATEYLPEVSSEDCLLQYLLERSLDWRRFKDGGIYVRVEQLH